MSTVSEKILHDLSSAPDIPEIGMALASELFRHSDWHKTNDFEPAEGVRRIEATEPEFYDILECLASSTHIDPVHSIPRALVASSGKLAVLSKPKRYRLDIVVSEKLQLTGSSGNGWEMWWPQYRGDALITGAGYDFQRIREMSGHEKMSFAEHEDAGLLNRFILEMIRPGMPLHEASDGSCREHLTSSTTSLMDIVVLAAGLELQDAFPGMIAGFSHRKFPCPQPLVEWVSRYRP